MTETTSTHEQASLQERDNTSRHLSWRVLKFGGTSVRDAERINTVAELVDRARTRADRVAVVVSALGGTTDQLLELVEQRKRRESLPVIVERHQAAAHSLGDACATAEVDTLLEELNAFVEQLPLAAAAISLEQTDLLMSFGERLSAPLVAGALRQRGVASQHCDMRGLVSTSERFSQARVDEIATFPALAEHFGKAEDIQVATGFLGAAKDGRTTTLGRGGSDLTAALLGAALDADEIEIWTDVDGVLSADPRVVAEAKSIDRMTYEEVMELAHFGAKVLYPPTVTPARARRIPLRILNTLNPAFGGTVINNREPSDANRPLRPFTGITAVDPVALLTLVGSGMLGVTGTAHRFFGALASVDCNAILISQASSEHSICAAIPPDRAEQARTAVDREFDRERRNGRVQPADIEPSLSVVAVVGEGMRERPGVAAEVFNVLGRCGINIRAIAQGSSELNISVAVRQSDRVATVQALHAALFGAEQSPDGPLPVAVSLEQRPIDVVVAGVGGVGAQLLPLLEQTRDRLRLVGVTNSRNQSLATETKDVDLLQSLHSSNSKAWREHLAGAAPNDASSLLAWLKTRQSSNANSTKQQVFVDCTASADVAQLYPEIVATGTSIVAANKIGLIFDSHDHGPADDKAPVSLWSANHDQAAALIGRVRYEATVGAGLPVISTLRSLLASGDEILEISGVFSGTLGYLLAQLRQGAVPSTAIRAAFDAGYTEPDPRDDLSGTDVARKLLILARTCGARVNLSDIQVEPLVPFDPNASIETFWKELANNDVGLQERLAAADSQEQTLAYLARLSFHGGHREEPCRPSLHVGLVQLPAAHPACQLQGTDNLFSFRTARYDKQPLTVRGPGAGTVVTAAGVLSDLLSIQTDGA